MPRGRAPQHPDGQTGRRAGGKVSQRERDVTVGLLQQDLAGEQAAPRFAAGSLFGQPQDA